MSCCSVLLACSVVLKSVPVPVLSSERAAEVEAAGPPRESTARSHGGSSLGCASGSGCAAAAGPAQRITHFFQPADYAVIIV